jgi:hypothetical protein
MGALPSSIKNTELGKIIVNKKITSQVPIFLIKEKFYHNKNIFVFRLTNSFDKKNNESDLVIKLKPNIIFTIDDIISYCYNEGGVYTYNCWICFLNKITNNDILEIIGNDLFFSEIFDFDKKTFNMKKLNEITYCSSNIFIDDFWEYKYKSNFDCDDVIFKYQKNKNNIGFYFEKLDNMCENHKNRIIKYKKFNFFSKIFNFD